MRNTPITPAPTIPTPVPLRIFQYLASRNQQLCGSQDGGRHGEGICSLSQRQLLTWASLTGSVLCRAKEGCHFVIMLFAFRSSPSRFVRRKSAPYPSQSAEPGQQSTLIHTHCAYNFVFTKGNKIPLRYFYKIIFYFNSIGTEIE